ncbi:hypothetical protein BGZ65_002513, partial [Modicella reniformis]
MLIDSTAENKVHQQQQLGMAHDTGKVDRSEEPLYSAYENTRTTPEKDQSSEPVHETTAAENIPMDSTDASTDGSNETEAPKVSTGPANLTHPSDSKDPTPPANPTDPMNSSDLTNPAATDSENPTDSANPTTHTDPTSPTDPTDPTNPMDPTNLMNPTDPTSSTASKDSMDSTNPTDYTSSRKSVGSTDLTDPTDPTDPTGSEINGQVPIPQPKKRGRRKRDEVTKLEPLPPPSIRELRRGRSRKDTESMDTAQHGGSKRPLEDVSEADALANDNKRVHLDELIPVKGSSSRASEGRTSAKRKGDDLVSNQSSKKSKSADSDSKEEAWAEKAYEKQIQKRGVRVFKPVDIGLPARVVDRWAEVIGIPVRAAEGLVPFPFDDPTLFDTQAIAFIFITPLSVLREEATSDKESMEIYFIPQSAAGPGHAIDSCFSLSLMNMVLNSPAILEKCPEDLRTLATEILTTDNAAAAWQLFDLSPVGDTVHRAHEEAHILGEWRESETPNPEFDMRPYTVRLKEQRAKEEEHKAKKAATTTSPGKKRGRGGAKKGPGRPKENPESEPDEDKSAEHHIT